MTTESPKSKAPLLDRILNNSGRWVEYLFTEGRIVEIDDFEAGYRIITIQSSSIASANWFPGRRISIRTDFRYQSFTGFNWDNESGRLSFLVSSGEPELMSWSQSLFVGESIRFLGPTGFTELTIKTPSVIVLDETHMSFAKAISESVRNGDVWFIFDVALPDATRELLKKFNIRNYSVIQRQPFNLQTERLVIETQKVSKRIAAESIMVMTTKLDSNLLTRYLYLDAELAKADIDCKTCL